MAGKKPFPRGISLAWRVNREIVGDFAALLSKLDDYQLSIVQALQDRLADLPRVEDDRRAWVDELEALKRLSCASDVIRAHEIWIKLRDRRQWAIGLDELRCKNFTVNGRKLDAMGFVGVVKYNVPDTKEWKQKVNAYAYVRPKMLADDLEILEAWYESLLTVAARQWHVLRPGDELDGDAVQQLMIAIAAAPGAEGQATEVSGATELPALGENDLKIMRALFLAKPQLLTRKELDRRLKGSPSLGTIKKSITRMIHDDFVADHGRNGCQLTNSGLAIAKDIPSPHSHKLPAD